MKQSKSHKYLSKVSNSKSMTSDPFNPSHPGTFSRSHQLIEEVRCCWLVNKPDAQCIKQAIDLLIAALEHKTAEDIHEA